MRYILILSLLNCNCNTVNIEYQEPKNQSSFVEITREEYEIARMIHHEACNEPIQGKWGLYWVVRNRCLKGKAKGYGNTSLDVLFQKGQWKGISNWSNPCDVCLKSVTQAAQQRIIPENCTHYISKWDTSKFISRLKPVVKIGGHTFASM